MEPKKYPTVPQHLVLSPTRELAEQIYNETRSICGHLSQTHGVVLGGMNRQQEAKKLQNGVNVLVATPGRLLDHMQNTKGFVYHNLLALVIDEADLRRREIANWYLYRTNFTGVF